MRIVSSGRRRAASSVLGALAAALLALPIGALASTVGAAPVAGATETQSITWQSTPPTTAVVGGTYDVSASAPGGTVTFAVGTGSTACSITGATVDFTAVGTCTIVASQSGDSTYAPVSATQSISVVAAQQTQTITWSPVPPATVAVHTSEPLTATASSGLPVTISIPSGSTTICSYGSGTITFGAAGTCTILASVGGNASYGATSTQQNVTVSATTAGTLSSATTQTQTITFDPASVTDATVGGTTPLTATATSGLPVTLAVDASATSECSLSGGSVRFLAAGSCVVDASVAGTTSFAPANAQWTATVSAATSGTATTTLAAQSITFAPKTPTSALVGTSASLTATATSTLPVTLAIAGSSAAICSIDTADVVSFNAAGTCTVDAAQAGNGSYQPASAHTSITVATGTRSQTVTFTSAAPTGAVVGGHYSPSATSSVGLAVSISVDSVATGICSLSSGTVSFTTAGTCVLDASQPGTSTYAAASAQQSISVAKTAVTGTASVDLVAGGGSGAIDLTGLTAVQAASELTATSLSLEIPLAGNVSGATLPVLKIPSATVVVAGQALSIEGTAALPFGALPVMMTAQWPSSSSTAPVLTLGVRTSGLSLATLDPAWTGVAGAAVSNGEIIYASGTTSFDPSVFAGAASFYDAGLCKAGASTIALVPGANFCGQIAATAGSPLSSAL